MSSSSAPGGRRAAKLSCVAALLCLASLARAEREPLQAAHEHHAGRRHACGGACKHAAVRRRLEREVARARARVAQQERGGRKHVVEAGETLVAIAAHYGTSVHSLLAANPKLEPTRIRPGERIAIGAARRSIEYTVQPGDTMRAIAHAHRVSVGEILQWNEGLDPEHIRDGQVLRVYSRAPRSLSQSIGSPNAGRLVTGRRLPRGRGYLIRSAERAYGTDETVHNLVAAFAQLRRHYPHTPRLWIHDLSLRDGGPMRDHHSHQSGRDADVAYVQRHCRRSCGFRPLSPSELDAKRTWALLRYWLKRDALEAVFVDYRLQAPLYRAARADGASAEQLRRWFQYPRGRHNPGGIIRHFPNHDSHMHVRFACPASDPACKALRPVLMHMAAR